MNSKKIVQTEHAYIKCFSQTDGLEDRIRYDDKEIPGMYSHNLTYILSNKSRRDVTSIVKEEMAYRQNGGHSFLNIHTEMLEDLKSVQNIEGYQWTCQLMYFEMDLNFVDKLKVRQDCQLRLLDEEQVSMALAFDEVTNGEELGLDFVRERFDRRSKVYLEAGGVDSYLCYMDQQVVAHVDLFINEGIAKIEDFDVLPTMQRQGIGTTVLSAIVQIAMDQGAERIYLITAQEDTAKTMYEKCGMTHIGDKYELFFGFKA